MLFRMSYLGLLLIIYLFYTTVYANLVFPCVTPDDEHAYCVSLFSCPHLMKRLSTLEPADVEYVKQSICLGCEAGDFMVCCDPPKKSNSQKLNTSSTTAITTTTTVRSSDSSAQEELTARFNAAVKERLLPDYKYCGYQHTDDRFYNSSKTALDEFPWMVHIRFSHHEYEEQYADRCSGVLINNRYVLTDAYCGLEAIKVKLGEYNTNQTVSCDTLSKTDDCSEPTQDISIEEIIRDGKSSNGPYDFVLLRLSKNVDYSDFIRPICLPIDQSKRPELKSLVFSGWGAPNHTGVAKKKLTYNIVSDQVCYDQVHWLEGNVKFANVSFICTSPPLESPALACSGEHGGPFMYNITRQIQWYIEGVIVNVMYKEGERNTCNDKYPVNGIRITENTIDWILSTIRL